jgi:heat shock protein HslJ
MKKKIPLLCVTTGLLVACQTIPTNTTAIPGISLYSAAGTEPFWSLKVTDNDMRFERSGVRALQAEGLKTVKRGKGKGTLLSAGSIVADITPMPCSDGISDRRYRDTVTLKVGTQNFKGCGGGILAPEKMDGTSWRIVAINGELISAEPEATLQFDAARMSGSVGCNRFGGNYSFSNAALNIGPLMSTKMGCPDPIAAREFGVMTMLQNLKSTEFAEGGEMILVGTDGYTVILEQVI